MTSNTVVVTNCRSGYLDCSTKHITLARQKVVSVFSVYFNISKIAFCSSARSVVCSGAALSVRKRTLSAPAVRWMWQSHVGWLYCRPRAGGAIVVIVALAGLVALGGGGAAGHSRARFSRRTTAEMHPMTQASSGTPHTKHTAGERGTVANARGAHSPSAITRMIFGIMDIERTLFPYFSLTDPIVRFQSGSNQVPMRFQWR